MCTLYENIISLCQDRGIKGGKMCTDLGLSKSLLSDLKSGRKRGITAETAQKIAEYFGVSVDRVLNGTETKKAPTQEGEREVSDEDIMFALFGGSKNVTPAMYDEVKKFAKMVQLREEAERNKKE